MRGIAGHISVGAGNDYMAARSPAANGWSFSISNVPGGDDQYVNRFSVSISSTGKSTDLRMNGSVHVYKEVSKNALFCTARAWASGDIAWSGVVSLTVEGAGLKIAHDFKTDSNQDEPRHEQVRRRLQLDRADRRGVLDVFTGFSDNFYFRNLVSNAFSVNVPGIGNVSVGLGALSIQSGRPSCCRRATRSSTTIRRRAIRPETCRFRYLSSLIRTGGSSHEECRSLQ